MPFFIKRIASAFIADRFVAGLARPPARRSARKQERALLRAFRHAGRVQPVYRRFLAANGVTPDSVKTASAFKTRVPVVGKEEIFGGDGLRGFFTPRSLERLATFYTSSGFTRRFAFGALGWRDRAQAAFFIEEILFRLYGIRERRVLVINCLSLGTEIPLTKFAQAKTGLRSDSVVEVIRRAAAEFEAVALIGEPLFIKRVAEEGTAAGIAWDRLTLYVFTGSEYVSEYWRLYLSDLFRQDPERPERGGIYLTYGLTEFGLAVGFETAPLAALRRALVAERARKPRGNEAAVRSVPPFLHYLPGLYHLEIVSGPSGAPQLAITGLDRRRFIPLIRYRTGDEAQLLSPADIAGLLSRYGLADRAPVIRSLPALALHGRPLSFALAGGRSISANDIKDALFRDHLVAKLVTGNFRLEHGPEGKRPRLLVQLAPGITTDAAAARRLNEVLTEFGLAELTLQTFAYRDFPFGFAHEFERKNVTVVE